MFFFLKNHSTVEWTPKITLETCLAQKKPFSGSLHGV